jgi:serine/threonine protein kinase
MSVIGLSDFVQALEQYQLLRPEQLAPLRQLQAKLPASQDLARELIKRGWLTPYQANQLLQGHGERLALGPYRLLERLGEGGMGMVFKARHLKMDRAVALKLVRKEFLATPHALERFGREVRAAANLSHPNIVAAFDAAEVGGCHYLAMEHVDGIDLARQVKRGGPLPIGAACEFVRQAARGLQHAHERKVVHRDIKPGNLLVTRPEPDGPVVVKILDFGLARFESERSEVNRVTQVGSFVGTVDYIAPEQGEDARAADIRADIYALGGTLFFLLTGQAPFAGKNLLSKMTAKMMHAAPSVRALRPEVPAELDAVVAKMMAPRPEDRYQTPRDVVAALQPFAREEAVPLLIPGAQNRPASPNDTTRTEAMSGSHAGDTARTPEPLPVTVTIAMAPQASRPAPPVHPVSQLWRLPPSRQLLIAGGAGVALLVLLILVVALWPRSGDTPPEAGTDSAPAGGVATLTIKPLEPITLAAGESKVIPVAVERKHCDGPIEVRAERLPEGATVAPLTIPAAEKACQLKLETAAKGKGATTEIRIVAQAGTVRAEAMVKLVVEGLPTGKALLTYNFGPEMQLDFKAVDAEGTFQNITYGRGTSNTVLQLDGRAVEFGSTTLGSWDPKLTAAESGRDSHLRKRRKSTWVLDTVQVTQTVELVPNPKGDYDTALVTYRVVNTDGQPHRLGLRCMVDTMMGANDGHPFIVPGKVPRVIRTRADFLGAMVPTYVTAAEQSDLKELGLTAQFTLKPGGGLEAADRFSITTWPGLLRAWDLPVLDIGKDAAVVIYWNAKAVPAGGERRLGYAYGLGVVSADGPGRWTSRAAALVAGTK